MNTKKLCLLSLLTAIALIIFIVELRIPNLVLDHSQKSRQRNRKD